MSTGSQQMAFVGKVAQMREPSLEDFKGAETWPMPVSRFLAGDYLKRADIVLSRHAGSPFSYFIRKTTGSVFSHAGLVFHVRDQDDGYVNNFIIEAGTSGVDLTNLRDYCSSPYYIVGIKRLAVTGSATTCSATCAAICSITSRTTTTSGES